MLITQDNIISFDYKYYCIIRNGGSKQYTKELVDSTIVVTINSENFRYKKTNNPRLESIEIIQIFKQNKVSEDGTKTYNTIRHFNGIVDSLEDLEKILSDIEK